MIGKASTSGNGRTILLPEETHDRSFAMTSSFSCMMYAALAALSGIDGMRSRIEPIAQTVETVIKHQAAPMRALAGRGYERVVYLGSHVFKGLAREAALKLLELTDGGMIAASCGFTAQRAMAGARLFGHVEDLDRGVFLEAVGCARERFLG